MANPITIPRDLSEALILPSDISKNPGLDDDPLAKILNDALPQQLSDPSFSVGPPSQQSMPNPGVSQGPALPHPLTGPPLYRLRWRIQVLSVK
jgi:hypothetical protein